MTLGPDDWEPPWGYIQAHEEILVNAEAKLRDAVFIPWQDIWAAYNAVYWAEHGTLAPYVDHEQLAYVAFTTGYGNTLAWRIAHPEKAIYTSNLILHQVYSALRELPDKDYQVLYVIGMATAIPVMVPPLDEDQIMQLLWVENYHAGFGTRYDASFVEKRMGTLIAREALSLAYRLSYHRGHGTQPPTTDIVMVDRMAIVHLRLAMLLAYGGDSKFLHTIYRAVANAKDPVAEADRAEATISSHLQSMGLPFPRWVGS